MYTADEIDALIAAELPDAFLRRVVGSLLVAYQAADQSVRAEHDPEEVHDVIGHVRRAKFETELRSAAKLSGLDAAVVPVSNQASRHTEVTSATLLLVAARVEQPGALPPHAAFRKTLASNGQLSFEGHGRSDADSVLGLFAHSRGQWTSPDEYQKWGHLPGSLYLLFPDNQFTTCVHRINLFERYHDVVRRHAPTEWDEPMLLRYIERSRRRAA